MRTLWRRLIWWLQQRRKEAELSEELQFHLDQEECERRAAGLAEDEARWAARRDLGNEARVREDARELWTWRPLDELSQDVRFASRTLFKHRAVAMFAVVSLALGIGANTAIYSFMDAILVRSLPVADPASLVVMNWRAKPFNFGSKAVNGSEFVLHSINGSVDTRGANGRIFPFGVFERLQEASAPLLSSLFAYYPAGRVNVMINGEAELVDAEYVSGDFFRGLAVSPAAGRLIGVDDDRKGAPPIAVVSEGYGQRRFGAAVNAVGQPILIDNVPFTVAGVAPAEFFGVDPSVGLYSTMAYGVARRTREIGIRMALGARRAGVIWMVLREVCILMAVGLLISVPIARATSRLIASLLFDMTPNDPSAIVVAVTALLGAALIASYGPARRAARIDPTTALREE
ncbi:MAG: ABC transporter permease [Acidobacteriota bacterium]|nr:ABC transporter permease [Acidobacteriota bacterium]